MNLGKGSGNEMAYLVPQGQQVVVEEDCVDRNSIILLTNPRTES